MRCSLPAVRRLIRAALGLALLWPTGCAMHPPGQHGAACPAIEAATKIPMSGERLDVLERIAARPDLNQHEQSYLVGAILYGGAGGPQADALIVLIHNPACTAQTRTEIARKLDAVAYSNGRRRVADALSAVPEAPAATTRPAAPTPAAAPQHEGGAGGEPAALQKPAPAAGRP